MYAWRVIFKAWLSQPTYHIRLEDKPWVTLCGLRCYAHHTYLPFKHAHRIAHLCKNCERSM